MAGLVCYYGHDKYIYLHVTQHEARGRVVDVSCCLGDVHARYPLPDPVAIPWSGPVRLAVHVCYDEARLSFGPAEGRLTELPLVLDYSHLCDEVAGGTGQNFTGTFVGICCQDLTGSGQHADFSSFSYVEEL